MVQQRIELEEAHSYSYYDFHPTEEDCMSEASVHEYLIRYLMEVLIHLFAGKRCALYANLGFYRSIQRSEYPVAPDIAVLRGVEFRDASSWRVGQSGPAPHVVVEIASEETWRKDLNEKPRRYARLGIEEYFAYDPHQPPLLKRKPRLYGWRLNRGSGVMEPMPMRLNGGLWSPQLQSLLVPDGKYLRLLDHQGQVRLTRAEAEAQRADMEAKARQTETRRADREAKASQAEMRRAEAEARRADMEAKARQAEARRAEALAEKLRSLGIDPDQL